MLRPLQHRRRRRAPLLAAAPRQARPLAGWATTTRWSSCPHCSCWWRWPTLGGDCSCPPLFPRRCPTLGGDCCCPPLFPWRCPTLGGDCCCPPSCRRCRVPRAEAAGREEDCCYFEARRGRACLATDATGSQPRARLGRRLSLSSCWRRQRRMHRRRAAAPHGRCRRAALRARSCRWPPAWPRPAWWAETWWTRSWSACSRPTTW